MEDAKYDEIVAYTRLLFVKHREYNMDVNKIAEDEDLNNYGLDSLNIMKILYDLEKRYKVEFEDDVLDNRILNSFKKMAEYVLYAF